MVYKFYENQEIVANEIVSLMAVSQCLVILMLAQMQSGKTGTYLKVAIESVKSGINDHVIIISGSRDTSLRAQTKKDLEDAIKSECGITGENDTIEALGRQAKLTSAIKIYWSQDLKEGKGPESIQEKTLIIHDESHAAQSKNNKPYEDFYKRHGIEKALYGDNSQINEKKIHILNVSATPFSELVAEEYVKNDLYGKVEQEVIGDNFLVNKSVIFADPGKGYIGVKKLLVNNIHFDAKKIDNSKHGHIQQILLNNKETYSKKYCIVRTNCAHKDEEMMRKIARDAGYEYVSVFATTGNSKPSEALGFLETEPTMGTIVHICGKARMGQVIGKKYIAMVYEQADNPKTDTILQGLLGRMCGYYTTKIPDIFISPKKEKEIRKYADAWEHRDFSKLLEIKKAMNINGGSKADVSTSGEVVKIKTGGGETEKWIKTIPMEITLSEIGGGDKTWKDIKTIPVIESIIDILEVKYASNPDIVEIIETLKTFNESPDHMVGFRKVTSKSYIDKDYVKRFEESAKKFTRDSVDLHIDKPIQIVGSDITRIGDVNDGKSIADVNPEGKIFIIGYVEHEIDKHGAVVFNLPKVNEICNYIPSIQIEGNIIIDDFNGGQIINFPFKETAYDINAFKNKLCEFIERTIPGEKYIEGCQSCITKMFDHKTGNTEGIYILKKLVNVKIISNIEEELNKKYGSIDLKFNKHKGNTNKKGFKKFESIVW